MAAMALAAMTQELSVMKQSLQAEVGPPRKVAETLSSDLGNRASMSFGQTEK